MIIDPKLEKMFRQCHEHKRQLDKKRRLVRAAMFSPPALLTLMCFIHMVFTLFSGLAITLAGGIHGVNTDAPCFIVSVITAVFAAGETILENKSLIEVSGKFYPVAAVVYLILFSVTVSVYKGSVIDILGTLIVLGQLGMVLSCVLSSVLNILFKRYYSENEMLRTLKGYPHFNPLLMTARDLREEDTPDRTPPEELSPDERLMRERDGNL